MLRAEIAEKLWGAHREELSVVLAGIRCNSEVISTIFPGDGKSFQRRLSDRNGQSGENCRSEKMFDLFFTPHDERETFTPNGETEADFHGFPELGGRQLRDAQHLVTFEIPEQPISDRTRNGVKSSAVLG